MKKSIAVFLSFFTFGGLVQAQTLDSQYGIDSIQTIIHESIYSEYHKHKNYKEAYPAWRYIFQNAPKFRLSTYTKGIEIVDNMIRLTNNKAYIDTLMMVYDQWLKYFGDDARFGRGYVLGRKGSSLYNYRNADFESVKTAYGYLNESFEILKAQTHPLTAKMLYVSANDLLKKSAISKDEYVLLYTKLTAYAKSGIEKAQRPERVAQFEDVKNTVDVLFFGAGVADCGTLDQLLTARFKQDATDKDELNGIARLLRRGECTDLPLFSQVSEDLYKIDPTADAAYSLAITFLKSKDYDKTNKYLQEAIQKATDKEDKAEYYLKYAQMRLSQGQLQDAKKNAVEALALNPTLGRAYIVIGQAYAAYAKNYGEDEFDHASVYWAVVDKFQKAKQVDPAFADEADRLIRSYEPHFPSKEETFFKTLHAGDNHRIGGWINETTKVRIR
ncbi:hypothetical protein FACS1894199_07800 [Bacteroidia bacterium]|nr:hypothetical protein FACS1894199_07800 [Bacteroidia bacterium]